MKIENIIDLVRYHFEKDDLKFKNEVIKIANEFDQMGKKETSRYLIDLCNSNNFYVAQNLDYKYFQFLKKIEPVNTPLYLPKQIENDILGIVRSSSKNIPISKILFYGEPGTGKTQSAYQIARILNRDLLVVRVEDLIDSHLGQTSKNIISMFDEIKHLYTNNVVILFDEIDSLVMSRTSNNDLREMGRVTTTFLKELEDMDDKIMLIATTNLKKSLDEALLRRFDAQISFDRYSKEDLIDISSSILMSFIKKTNSKSDIRLFNKILSTAKKIPYPGEMKQIIKISLAFADDNSEYDYLKRIYLELHKEEISIKKLSDEGFTTREIEILTGISKSTVSRKQNGGS